MKCLILELEMESMLSSGGGAGWLLVCWQLEWVSWLSTAGAWVLLTGCLSSHWSRPSDSTSVSCTTRPAWKTAKVMPLEVCECEAPIQNAGHLFEVYLYHGQLGQGLVCAFKSMWGRLHVQAPYI